MSAVFSSKLGSLFDDVDGKVIRRIPVSLIDPDLDQPRKEIKQSDIEERGNSMASEGQLQPVELVEQPDGRYKIVFGELRWRGAVWKGIQDLEAVVHPVGTGGMDRKKTLRRQLIENLQRSSMNAMDTAQAIKLMIDEEGSAAAAGRALGLSEGQISKYMSVLSLPPSVAKLASEDVTRDVETLSTVAKIERDDPAAARSLIAEARTTGKLSRSRAREVAQAVNEALKQKRSTKALFESGKGAVKSVEPKDARQKVVAVAVAADHPKPVKVRDGETLAIAVKIVETSRDAKRFSKAQTEHGEARLYQGGVSQTESRCWVLFGDSPRAKKTDQEPRLQEFPCSAIVLSMVTKYRPVAEG